MCTTRLYVYMYSIIIIMILLNLCMDGKGVCCDGWIFSFSYNIKPLLRKEESFFFWREFVWLVDDREDLMRPWETTLLASSSSYCCVL